jgi:hypothetical protein
MQMQTQQELLYSQESLYQGSHHKSARDSSKKIGEPDTKQFADKNLTAKPYCSGKNRVFKYVGYFTLFFLTLKFQMVIKVGK